MVMLHDNSCCGFVTIMFDFRRITTWSLFYCMCLCLLMIQWCEWSSSSLDGVNLFLIMIVIMWHLVSMLPESPKNGFWHNTYSCLMWSSSPVADITDCHTRVRWLSFWRGHDGLIPGVWKNCCHVWYPNKWHASCGFFFHEWFTSSQI